MINHHNCKRSLHKGKASFFKLVGGETKNKKKKLCLIVTNLGGGFRKLQPIFFMPWLVEDLSNYVGFI